MADARVSSAPSVGEGLPRRPQDVVDERWMRRALELVGCTPAGDVPVAAVLVGADGRELAWGVNRREADCDPLGHAEIAAVRVASEARAVQGAGESQLTDGWRLTDCTLYVTLEPCAMCAGALVGARIGRIVFGAYEPNTGACGSVWDIPREAPLHKVPTRGGVLAGECESALREFFQRLRG